MQKGLIIILHSIICLIVNNSSNAQNTLPRNADGRVEYTAVVYVDSTSSKDAIYAAARAWFVDNFKDAKEVLQVQDKDAGELVGKGYIDIPSNRFGYIAIGVGIVWFNVTLYAKDGRYKYVISDFVHEGGLPQIRDCGSLDDNDPDSCSRSIFQEVKEKTDGAMLQIIADLRKSIEQNLKRASDDW
jgi:hypothetical protein